MGRAFGHTAPECSTARRFEDVYPSRASGPSLLREYVVSTSPIPKAFGLEAATRTFSSSSGAGNAHEGLCCYWLQSGKSPSRTRRGCARTVVAAFHGIATLRRFDYNRSVRQSARKGEDMPPTKEMEYIERIDASFPYDDEKAWKAIIDEGIRLSGNAAYMALLATCSSSAATSGNELERLIRYWSSRYDHPTKPAVLKAARALIGGSDMPEDECLRYLSEIAAYPGLYNAVGIVWRAAPRDEGRVGKATEAVERKCEEIYNAWVGQGNA
jgi:hypothetical protein